MQNYLNTRFPALKHSDFRLFWSSLFISNVGSQMQFVAINWQVYELTHSAFALGMVGLLRFIPISLFSLIGGSVADAHNRKKILFVTQSTLTLLSFVLALITFQHSANVVIIFLITALSAGALAFDMPARQAFFPSLVNRTNLRNALALNSIMFQVATILGPTISGFAIARSGVGLIYSVNSASFLFVLLSLFLIKEKGDIKGLPTKISISSVLEGLSFVKTKTIIWSMMILDFFSTFFSSATALMPIFAKDILHVGPTGLGLLYAGPSAGAIVAGLFIAHRHKLRRQGMVLMVSVIFYAIGTVIFGLSKELFISLIALFIIGAGDSISMIIRQTVRQLETPDSIRGRMTSINMIFAFGGPQLGDFEAGALASLIGAPLSVVTGGVGTFIVIAIMLVAIPKLRNYDYHKGN